MNESSIGVRYAKALFLLAQEKNILEQVREDMLLVEKAMKENSRFGLYLDSPVVRPSQKRELISKVFQNHINVISLNFLDLLIQNKRENYLESIFRRFFSDYRKYKGIKTAMITTANKISNSTYEKIKLMISNIFKSEIELNINIDAGIIGGYVLRVEDQQYDASVSTGLKRIKKSLLNSN